MAAGIGLGDGEGTVHGTAADPAAASRTLRRYTIRPSLPVGTDTDAFYTN